jgi:hypothetical protein
VDVEAAVAGGLRVAGDARLVEQGAQLEGRGTDVVERRPRLRIEVETELVGVPRIVGLEGPDVEAQAAEVDRPRDVREVGGDTAEGRPSQ